MDKPIIVTEFPKSGGSWIVSMIGEALNIPRRDIYVRPGFDLFEITHHPWYKGGQDLDVPKNSVIKSHELPDSALIDFDATYIHLVRDGRDVIVSKWFFDKDFCVKNGIILSFNKHFDAYVEEVAKDWVDYVIAWNNRGVLTVRYEDFLSTPENALGDTLKQVSGVDFHKNLLREVVSRYTKQKFSESLSITFRHNTFVRKGVSGDWKNYFSRKNLDSFNSVALETMLLLGYKV